MRTIIFTVLFMNLFVLNSYSQISHESIKRCEVKSFLRTYLFYVDLNPMWQDDANEINTFIEVILAENTHNINVDSLRMNAFQLLYNNTWTIFEDAADRKRMYTRRSICFLAISLLSDDYSYRAFIDDARANIRQLGVGIDKEETLIDVVEILMILRDTEMPPREKTAKINNFRHSFNERKTRIDNESFVRDATRLFSLADNK